MTDGWQSPQSPQSPQNPQGPGTPPGPEPGFAPPPAGSTFPPPPLSDYYGTPAQQYTYGARAAGQPVYNAPYTGYYTRPSTGIGGLAVALTCVMAAELLIIVFAIVAYAQRVSALDRFASDLSTDLAPSDRMVGAVGVLNLLGYITLATLFMIWFWQARTNAELYAPGPMRLPRGWAIGAWFIPVANWVMPFLVAGDIHRGTTRGLPDRPETTGAVTRLWWGCFAVATVIEGVANIANAGADPQLEPQRYLNNLHDSAVAYLVALPLMLVAGAFMLVYVWQVTGLQKVRNQAFAGPVPGFGMYGYGYPAPGAAPMPMPMPGYGYQGGMTPPMPPMPSMPPMAPMPPAPPAQPVPPVPPVPPTQDAIPVQDAIPTQTAPAAAPPAADPEPPGFVQPK